MMAVKMKWDMFLGIIKEMAIALIVLLVAAGLSLFAYMAGQAKTETYIDSYFQEQCGEVPVYRKAGDGIKVYYVETKLRSGSCETGEEFVLWTIPKDKE